MKPSASLKKNIKNRSRFDSLTYFMSVCLAIIVIVGADVCFDVFHKNEDSKKSNTKTQRFVLLTHRPCMWLMPLPPEKVTGSNSPGSGPQQSGWQGNVLRDGVYWWVK